MIFYNFHIFPLLVIAVISGRIAIKFKTDIKDAIKSMWWINWIKGRSCGLGQSLVRTISHYFDRPKKKLSSPRQFFLCPLSWLIFLSRLDIWEWPMFKKDWTKNSREWTKNFVWSLGLDNYFLADQKIEKLTEQLISQRDWPKPHGHTSLIFYAIEMLGKMTMYFWSVSQKVQD